MNLFNVGSPTMGLSEVGGPTNKIILCGRSHE